MKWAHTPQFSRQMDVITDSSFFHQKFAGTVLKKKKKKSCQKAVGDCLQEGDMQHNVNFNFCRVLASLSGREWLSDPDAGSQLGQDLYI